jgi:AAA+ ATPase superfamily predicted ATPase
MFIGRISELQTLHAFKQRKIAGLAVVYGRRRIGKSTLIEHFAESSRFLEFYGLPPGQCTSNVDQLAHFGRQMGKAFDIPAMLFNSWFDALSTLAGLTKQGKVIIFLDEISWMAAYDKSLPCVLKGIWDTEFKKNKQLLLILCGSVSSWIEENILKDKGFMGRVSLQMKLEEMPLHDANKFWLGNKNISAAGFIKRDFVWNLNTEKSSVSKYRLRDNYLRFYLKYIEPKRELIKKNIYQEAHLERLPQWQTIMGLQFENFCFE